MTHDRLPHDGRRRVLVEGVSPEIDAGRYAVKRVVLDEVIVECDLVADGHDVITGRVLFRRAESAAWQTAPLSAVGNDRYRGCFVVSDVGLWEFTIEAWIDAFTTWRIGTERKKADGQSVNVELLIGTRLLAQAASRAERDDAEILRRAAGIAEDRRRSEDERFSALTDEAVRRVMDRVPDRTNATRYDRILSIVVDPERARFSTWYELFPRSCGKAGKHGTFLDVVGRLDDVASMGFDVLYLPPIHPIGVSFRKGRNNSLNAQPGDPGSPWAIGAREGGHKSIHPELGTLDDFRTLVSEARARGISIALDVAFQASPDHPYVKEHPSWFERRPDGTIQYAENPPKKYQDVLPFDFECDDWENLWLELQSVFHFWISEGVRIFRVDNPHTKSFRFWQWCIADIKKRAPDALFLAEAFTRPKVMYGLAKAGFSQSYTYFTWRYTKTDFEAYMRELCTPPVSDFYRPNFWPNTPDILPEILQYGGRPAFLLRLVLAATLSGNYGIYGPPYERMEHAARPGSEEYDASEKFEIRDWDSDRPHVDSIRDAIRSINDLRRRNPALQQTTSVTFHHTDNDEVLAYSKRAGDNTILIVVNFDVHRPQTARVSLDLAALGIDPGTSFRALDLRSGERSLWKGDAASIMLDPKEFPAKILSLTRHVRSEQDFEYYV